MRGVKCRKLGRRKEGGQSGRSFDVLTCSVMTKIKNPRKVDQDKNIFSRIRDIP